MFNIKIYTHFLSQHKINMKVNANSLLYTTSDNIVVYDGGSLFV